MEFYNQSFNQSSLSNNTYTEDIPVFVTYLSMAVVLTSAIIVITPAVMVINVIWSTRELHTKYYFFVANLLVTIVANKIVRSVLQNLIVILYLLDLKSDSTYTVLQWLIIPQSTILYLMIILLPITLAAERLIVIAFPFRHKSIMTTKTVAGMLAAMWGLSTILTIIITVIVPVEIVWPLGLTRWHYTIFPIVVIPRLTSTVFIIVANVFLQYKITITNRKARENRRLGNEEEAKRFTKLVQVFQTQVKATITLFLVGGVDVIANIMIPVMYAVIYVSVEPNKIIYFEQFLMYPIQFCLLLSHPVLYGLYMKKIRKRLPNCTGCLGQWTIRHNRVGVLHQQQGPTVMNATS